MTATWSFDQINSLLEKMRHEREVERSTWNKEFPPDVEVDVVIDGFDTPVKHGIWKVEDGIFIIAKSKNCYHPENRIYIPTEIVEEIRKIT